MNSRNVFERELLVMCVQVLEKFFTPGLMKFRYSHKTVCVGGGC